MSLGQIAARNLWQNRGRYMAYLASSAFSVMIYFLYTALSLHPKLKGGFRGAAEAAQGMKAAAVVIAIFMFLFLLYSNSAFVRSRMKEFGLLSLLGVGKWQLIQIILAESLIIGTAALFFGLLTGLLFLKLFLMAVSVLLRLPTQLPFYAGPRVWGQTLTVFGSFFAIVSAISLFSVLRRNIIQLVRAGRQPKETPTFSRWKALFGLILVIGGYIWAAFPHGVVVIIGVIPVTFMVSFGTYMLMKEGSVAFLTWLHRREGYFYRPGPFLTVSQLVYKIQDNYRVLAAVTILVAVILTAVGTSVSLYVVVAEDARDMNPHALQLVQTPGLDLNAETQRINAALQQQGVTGLTERKIAVIPAQLSGKAIHVGLIPYSFYTSVTRPNAQALPLSNDYDAILVDTAAINERRTTLSEIKEDQLQVAGQTLPLRVKRDTAGKVMNPHTQDLTDVLVFPDDVYKKLLNETPSEQAVNVALWVGETWNSKPVENAIAQLREAYPKGGPVKFSTTQENYQSSILTMGLLVFIGLFVSLVFFAACCSLLYFRLFTEIDEDRKYIARLQQLGVGNRDLKKVALRQSAAIFFIPFIGGLLHSTFAMQGLGTIVSRTVLQIGWAVALGYLVLYAVLFRAINSFYWRSLRVG